MTATAPRLSTSAPAAATARGQRMKRLAPYLFVAPNMLIFAVFIIWPAISGFNISFYDSGNGRSFEWVGLGNYARLGQDAEFWAVLRGTALFTIVFGVLATWLSILLAALLDAQVRGRGFFRAVFFVPVLLSPVVVGLLWNWMLDRQVGLVNSALGAVGLAAPAWLTDPALSFAVVVFVGLWTHVGFYAMIMLAGLQGIDRNVYEAARLDGAGPFRIFWSVTLPLLRPTTLVVVVLSTVNGFQAYDYIYTLTGGGPLGATTLLVQYIYDNAFRTPISYGYASAAGVVLFGVIFLLTLGNFIIGRRRESV